MKLSARDYKAWDNKCITLLGMSGVGKTRLAIKLRKRNWFHYSGDYRIGTRYLDEAILDHIKQQAVQVPFLRELLRSDSIDIRNNITVDNLQPVSSFLGKLGNPEKGGLGLKEFKHRQELHRQAEIATMRDVPEFIGKAREIYGYTHFVNDAGGSLCELDDPATIQVLADHTLILYIKANEKDEHGADPPRRGGPEAALLPRGISRRAAGNLSAREEIILRGADRSGRFRALDVPAPVSFTRAALSDHRRPAWLHRQFPRARARRGTSVAPSSSSGLWPPREGPGRRGMSRKPGAPPSTATEEPAE